MKESKLPASFDARDWAEEFVEMVKENPSIATDIDTMTSWFANAIMRGWDERDWRHDSAWEDNFSSNDD